MTRSGLQPIRATDDVDIIVEVASRVRYYAFAEKLRELGFHEDVDAKILCRWRIDGITVDAMPTDTSILGFSNRWYASALEAATELELEQGTFIRLITVPHFLATKMEAFNGRGHGDFLISHDINDMLMVILGRQEIVDEVSNASPELRAFIVNQFAAWLTNHDFMDAISGHLYPDEISQSHQGTITQRIRAIAALK